MTEALHLPSSAYEIKMFGEFVSFQKIDIAAVLIASIMVAGLGMFFQKNSHRPCAARGGRQP